MLIREYTDRDLDALRAIHAAQGFDYTFPDLRNPLLVTKLVLTGDSVAEPFKAPSSIVDGQPPNKDVGLKPACAGRPGATQEKTGDESEIPGPYGVGNCLPADRHGPIFGAAFLRLTAEAYLLLDPRAGTPRERWQWLLALHEAAHRDAWLRGLEDVHAWLPPRIAQKFGRRLERLGWRRDDSWTPYCKRLEGN